MAESRAGGGPGARTLVGVVALYAASLAAATYPYVTRLSTDLPCGGDPPQHLWIMRWYRSCLLEGRSPLFCPELHHPVGVPLGNFSPLHVQSLLFLPLSLATGNDALSYNVIWVIGMLTTGLGTFLLAWHALRDRAGAAAGLLAMLSGPLMLHALAHLELTFVGSFPLFLLAWTGFVDAPGRGRGVPAPVGVRGLFRGPRGAGGGVLRRMEAGGRGEVGAWRWLRPRLG